LDAGLLPEKNCGQVNAMEGFLIGLLLIAAGMFVWPLVAARHAAWVGWLAAVVPAGLCALLLFQSGQTAAGHFPQWSMVWFPEMGVSMDFRLDGVGLLLSVLIAGIGALILIYGGSYLSGTPQAGPFFVFVQLFMLAMLGVASADNLLLLFVFWELTSIASYFLIGLSHHDEAARKSALRALLVTGSGGLCLLAGILLLGSAGGTFRLSELQTMGDVIRGHAYYPAIFVLVVLGAFTKSAQVPFHFWLPEAMAAPTPVSAYLHSATMVKAGVFLLAKLLPVLGGTVLWHDTLTLFGAVTMFAGALLALVQTDLKRLLAYSTLSALGTLVMLLGIRTDMAVKAAMVFLVVHALYKAPLFMIAGVVDKAAGTRNITLLYGLGRKLPWVAAAAVLAAFSMSGLPPFVGFIGKELLYEAEIHAGRWAILVTCLGFAANAINVTVALKVGVAPFRPRGGETLEINPKARKPALLIGPMLLAVGGVIIGLFPNLLGKGLIFAAVRDVKGAPIDVGLALWHGFNLLVGLSAVTVLVGVALYWFRDPVRTFLRWVLIKIPGETADTFDRMVAGVVAGAGAVTRFFQHGNLRLYITAMLLCLSSLVTTVLFTQAWRGMPENGPVRFVPTGVALLMVVSGVVAIRSRSTVMAVLAMGGVGYGVALLFAFFGAPDLALTQILVETLTLVLFALVIRHLPALGSCEYSSKPRRRWDLLIALLAGSALTLAMLAVRGAPSPEDVRVSSEMVARSLPEAQGRNVVNVILVDFRALDTLGEICVLAIAGLGVAGLLLGPHRRDRRGEQAIATPLYRTAVTWMTPLLLFMSVLLLFRGHNEPGGGFIGGLVAAAGLVLKRLAAGDVSPHAGRIPLRFIAAGIAIAVASTLPSVLSGRVFMEGIWIGKWWLPLVGKTGFGTPFLFDVGVYLAVIGVGLLILTRLIRSEPRPLRPE
jgi:multicomponent Na+:H+ antiporter subunit A